MEITNVRAPGCPDGDVCPSIDLIDEHPDRVYFIGKVETDPAILAEFGTRRTGPRIGPGEGLFWQPRDMHPGV